MDRTLHEADEHGAAEAAKMHVIRTQALNVWRSTIPGMSVGVMGALATAPEAADGARAPA